MARSKGAWYRSDDGQGTMHLDARSWNELPKACRAPALQDDNRKLGMVCGRVSVALCDAPAGEDPPGTPVTCSMPICRHHRTPHPTQGDVDYCPRHRGLAFKSIRPEDVVPR